MDLTQYATRDPNPHVEPAPIAEYLDALFGRYEWQDGEGLCLRGLGEKGTGQEGGFREAVWVTPPQHVFDVKTETHARRWCEHGHGAFIVPAVCRVGAPGTGAKDADVLAYTALCLDLDDPEHAESTLHMVNGAIGPASIVVESSPGKRHAYWLFNEPETDTKRVAKARHVLALKTGGDPSFQRLPQVIRIPGTVHNKRGIKSKVELLHCDADCVHSFAFLEERIAEMFPLPNRTASADAELGRLNAPVGGGFRFTPEMTNAGLEPSLTQDITEGGNGAENRWSVFNQVAGNHIRAARTGEITLDEAKNFTAGWVAAHMIPPWPAQRFESEWRGLLERDAANHGPMNDEGASIFNRQGIQVPAPIAPVQEGDEPKIMYWAVGRRFDAAETPERKWLVKGLVRTGALHVLAAEGGVGKTFALLELALKVGSPRPGDTWLGQPLDPHHTGGTAVIITTEDDKDEIHIRINALDPGGARRTAFPDRVLVVPLLNSGGVFPLVEMRGGIARPSPGWENMLREDLARLPDLKFVAIDTLAATLHGEENSSLTLQQYTSAFNLVQQIAPSCSTMVTHHVRKPNVKDVPIASAADMRNAVRGSNALLGAVRMAIGIWQHPQWADTLDSIGERARPNTLFQIAVVKGNNSEVLDGERTLLRTDAGALDDVTERVASVSGLPEQEAWIVWCTEQAVRQRRPFTATGPNSLFAARQNLPEKLRRVTREGFAAMVDILTAEDEEGRSRLVWASTTPNGGRSYLDVPEGDLAHGDLTGWQTAKGARTLTASGFTYARMAGKIVPKIREQES